ncbi:MAG: thiamine phosphate synthase [Candidatus Aminicenantes bacterium]|nr:thiamine phosphate synthase [Candidatus Aminicenantes bacterium]
MIDWSLYFIADSEALTGRNFLETIEKVVEGGATLIQLRGKKWSDREFFSMALEVKKILAERNIPLIINDRVDVALAVKAEGVHLGQKDLPIEAVRPLAPKKFIIGLSVNNLEEALRAEREGADYVGAGPIFWTSSKPDLRPPIGSQGLQAICQAIRIPVIAIGGITLSSIPEIIAAGASGIALISAITLAENPLEATRKIRNSIDLARKKIL